MAGGDAFGEAVRTAGVVRHVAADRARLLAARIGREVQAVFGDGAAEVEVEHSRLDPGPPCVRVDGANPVHLGERDDHCSVGRHGSPGQTGARAPGDERNAGVGGDAHARRHLGGGHGEADDGRHAGHVPGVATVQRQLGAAVADPVGAERPAQVLGERGRD